MRKILQSKLFLIAFHVLTPTQENKDLLGRMKLLSMETSPFSRQNLFLYAFVFATHLIEHFRICGISKLISETFFRQRDSTTLQAEINLMRIIQSITSIGVWFIPALIFSFCLPKVSGSLKSPIL